MRRLRRRYGRSSDGGYKVAYLGIGARRTHLAGEHTLDGAIRLMNGLKRQGRTTWVEDSSGGFVPVPGAKRRPGFND